MPSQCLDLLLLLSIFALQSVMLEFERTQLCFYFLIFQLKILYFLILTLNRFDVHFSSTVVRFGFCLSPSVENGSVTVMLRGRSSRLPSQSSRDDADKPYDDGR